MDDEVEVNVESFVWEGAALLAASGLGRAAAMRELNCALCFC